MDQIKLRLGQAVGLKELIATLVVAGLLLIVGTVVFAKVKASMQTGSLSAAANSTISNVEATTYNAFQLATVALIVLAAADHHWLPSQGEQIHNRDFNTRFRCVSEF